MNGDSMSRGGRVIASVLLIDDVAGSELFAVSAGFDRGGTFVSQPGALSSICRSGGADEEREVTSSVLSSRKGAGGKGGTDSDPGRC